MLKYGEPLESIPKQHIPLSAVPLLRALQNPLACVKSPKSVELPKELIVK